MLPFREVFFNIDQHLLFYGMAALATAVFVYGMVLRWRFWSSGWPEARDGGFDVGLVLGRALLNTSFFRRDPLGGLTHMLIMWGFVLLFIGTVLSTLDHWFLPFLSGGVYLVYALVLDLAGIALMAGVALAYLRRFVLKRGRMQTVERDHVVLGLLFFLALTGFLVEGFRLDAAPPPWAEPSPVGMWIAAVSDRSVTEALNAHQAWWWIHAAASLFLVAYFPFSKFAHVFAAGVNLTLEGMRSTSFLNLEEREALKSDFSFRHLVMMDACTQCDRCTAVCPSHAAGEPLSPRGIVDETGHFARGKAGFGLLPHPAPEPSAAKARAAGDQIWNCTTCGHCQAACPSAISPMELIREVRTARIEAGEGVPENVQGMLESVYTFKNPWEGAKSKRLEWASGLDVPVLSEGADEKRCLYVGCTIAYDPRLHGIGRSTVAAFRVAGLGFAVLGKEETCCGEVVRGVGEDGLFTEMAAGSLDTFDRYGIGEIVTPCPHGLHTFTNHYGRLDQAMKGRKAVHVSQALEAAVASGALTLEGRGRRKVTYHDPCFLGRRGGVYDAPRNVLRSIPGVELVEMGRSRENSFCCGGGGGRMWTEGGGEEKMSEIRLREAVGTGAEIMVTACPFCFTNFDDAVKTAGFEGRIVVKDLTELVAEALPGSNAT
ncbi:MAG TPA: heterodisulfide reductase-related iron-sulfur binding cluster [Longimicrobiales bacterium]|nr:heterodisulfide reductase-related iron-sulfur binding cluster [Longimicrobiales bacterium]